MKVRSRVLVWSALLAVFVSPWQLSAQQIQFGKIVGNVRVVKGDFSTHPVLISLEMRGSPIATTYSDDRGTFGFYNLIANQYRVFIDDDAYEPVSETTQVNPATSATNFLELRLVPRSKSERDSLPARVSGSNPYLVDPAEYYQRFPKKTVKEFEKGLDAEKHGKVDDAIAHYEKALILSPDFYPAHNNLGSAYLGRQNFELAQSHFEAALKSNRNDAQAHFNLANVLLLTQRFDASEHEIDEGLQKRPDSAFGYFLQGCLYSRTHRPELAEKSLLNAVRIDPALSQAYLQLVNLYVQEKRTADAISELEDYLKAFPSTQFSPQARNLLKRLQDNTAVAQ